MGTPGEPPPVKLIVALLAAGRDLLADARAVLEGAVAPVELASRAVEWRVSPYYQREMGDDIWRQYLALAGLAQSASLRDLKLRTNRLEERWRAGAGRRVNLDPGYVGLEKLVLASTKDAAHRIHVGAGIYAEVTLRYIRGVFAPWPYTYPDYRGAETLEFFTRVRERLRAELRARHRLPGRDAG